MKKILIIEDDKIKKEKLSNFFSNYEVVIKESYHSGLSELLVAYDEYSFLILDMTIPLWDKGSTDLGGNFEQFGGERILREMKRRKKTLPTILVTMFDIFPTSDGNLTFSQLNNQFLKLFPSFYIGAVFYDASEEGTWKLELDNMVNAVNRVDD